VPAPVGQAEVVRALGICLAVLLGAWGLWALGAARRADGAPVVLGRLGRVSGPTSLTLGLAALAVAYHALAYSVAPWIKLLAAPADLWWVVAIMAPGAALGALALDRREVRRSRDDGAGPE